MSKTERDLSTKEAADALDEMFDGDELELDIADLEANDDAVDATELRDVELDDVELDTAAAAAITTADDVELSEDGDADDSEVGGPTSEQPALAKDVTGEAVLPDTVPVLPHDDSDDGEDDDTADLTKSVVDDTPLDDDDTQLDDDGDGDTGPVDRESRPDDDPEQGDVSDDILEELRQADIDGPVVAPAPQDESTAMRRRPRRASDYDPAPVPIPAKVPRVLGRKPRVRRVTRVVRHVDPWSVFKIAIVANIVLYIIVLTASVLLWNVANATGTVQNVERFFESFGWNSFEFNGGEMYHAGWVAGLFVVIGLTGLAVLAATLFNLITDLVGGVRFTVLEEEVLETRTSPMRRFVVRRPEPEVPALLQDTSGAMIREAVVDDVGANARPTR